jgi:hypothetical protein
MRDKCVNEFAFYRKQIQLTNALTKLLSAKKAQKIIYNLLKPQSNSGHQGEVYLGFGQAALNAEINIKLFIYGIDDSGNEISRIVVCIIIRIALNADISGQLQVFDNFPCGGERSMPDIPALIDFIFISDVTQVAVKCP